LVIIGNVSIEAASKGHILLLKAKKNCIRLIFVLLLIDFNYYLIYMMAIKNDSPQVIFVLMSLFFSLKGVYDP